MRIHSFIALTLLLLALVAGAADEKSSEPQEFKYRIVGLFQPDREADLRELIARIPDVELVSVDYQNAEASFRFAPGKLFPRVKPEEVLERFNKLIRHESRTTFGVRPPCALPRSALTLVEIPIVGLDCKGCSYAVYEAIAKIDGVELATASFRDGKVSALIDPGQTGRAALEEALMKKRIEVKRPR